MNYPGISNIPCVTIQPQLDHVCFCLLTCRFLGPQEISDDLTALLAQLMSQGQIPEAVAAQTKSYVTYTIPSTAINAPSLTVLEGRNLLASSGVTGFRTWEAALHLGTFLCGTTGLELVKGKNILELGAGTGFISMLCAKHLNSKYVLATDGSGEVIDDLVSNLYLNDLDESPLIDATVLKWGHALIGESLSENYDANITYDLVIGADVVCFT